MIISLDIFQEILCQMIMQNKMMHWNAQCTYIDWWNWNVGENFMIDAYYIVLKLPVLCYELNNMINIISFYG